MGPSCAQQTFFDSCGVKNLIDRALDGYACTTFAFGQTGSGKTHTITGPDEGGDDGIIQRAIRFLWRQVAGRSRTTYTFQASYLEIYNEQVRSKKVTRGLVPVISSKGKVALG
jgi:hypothetical protein